MRTPPTDTTVAMDGGPARVRCGRVGERERQLPASPAQLLRLIGGAMGVVVALSSWPAEIFITGWDHGRTSRVAFLPDLPRTLEVLGLTLAALGVMKLVWIRRGGRLPHLAERAAPLIWLNVLAIPFAPVVTDFLPALAILSGPFRWVIVAVAVVGCVWPAAAPMLAGLGHRQADRPVLLAIAAFAIYAAVGAWVTRAQGLGGDEPHYLIITESLLRDGDLRIENNHTEGQYHRFFPVDLAPHFIKRGVGGVIYSVHAPGLPSLLLPAYAVAGPRGANLFMAVVAALAGLAVFFLARAVSTPAVALAVWAGTVCTTPFLMHGWLLYPEMVAAAVVAWALWWIWPPPSGGAARWAWRGLVLAVLPWLHVKFVVLFAGLWLGFACRLVRRPRALAAMTMPAVLSLALWFCAAYVMYGVADPSMPYGGLAAQRAQLNWSNVPRGFLGLFFDQEFGLLFYSPIYLVAAAGLVPLLQRTETRPTGLASLVVGTAFLLAITRYSMWWGGWSVPARFLVPVLPLLAPFLAAGIARLTRHPPGRALVAVLLAASLAAAALLVADPGRMTMLNDRDGTGKLLEWMQGPALLTTLFPSFLLEDWQAQAPRLAVPLGGLALGVAVFWAASRRAAGLVRADVHLAALFVVAVLGGVAVAGRMATTKEMRVEMVRTGQMALLNARTSEGAVDLSRYASLSAGALLDRLHVPLSSGAGAPPDDPKYWLGPWTLPPGTFEIRVWLRAGATEPGEFEAWFHRTRAVAARAHSARPVVILPVELPDGIELPPLWLSASTQALVSSAVRVELVPRVVGRATSRPRAGPRALENIDNLPGAYLIYLDREAFPEKGVFWTHGESATSMVVTTAGWRHMQAEVETGAAAGLATIDVGGIRTKLDLPARTREIIDLPVDDGKRTVPLRVAFDGGFRPSDFEHTSDHRWLGVRIRLFFTGTETGH